MMGTMECPSCGERFDDEYVCFLDNGNPACPHCVAEEQKKKEREDKENARRKSID